MVDEQGEFDTPSEIHPAPARAGQRTRGTQRRCRAASSSPSPMQVQYESIDTSPLCSTAPSLDLAVTLDEAPPRRLVQLQLEQQQQQQQQRLSKRQGAGVGNVAEGYPACNDVGNAVWACYPRRDTVLLQNSWSKFIWNTNYPVFIGAGYVDIHLYSAGPEGELATWRNVSTSRGSIGYQVDDSWMPTQTEWTDDQTLTHSYYFVIATRGADPYAGVPHQATFRALQTAPPATLAAQLAAASSSAASAASAAATAIAFTTDADGQTVPVVVPGAQPTPAPTPTDIGTVPVSLTGDLSTITNIAGLASAAASISSAEASLESAIASLSSAGSSIPSSLLSSLSALENSASRIASTESNAVSSVTRTRGPSSLQNQKNGGNSMPKWAIALLSIFGALLLIAALIGVWFCLRRVQRRKRDARYSLAGESGRTTVSGNSATGLAGAAGAGATARSPPMSERDRPVSSATFSDGQHTARSSMASSPPSASGGAGARALAGAGAGGLAGLILGGRRSTSPVTSTGRLERRDTDRTDSPYGTAETGSSPVTAMPAGAAAASSGRVGRSASVVANKPSQRSLAGSAIGPNDASIIAEAYRNILRRPEPVERRRVSSSSESGSTRSTPKAEGTTTPMAFGDSSGSEGDHHGAGRDRPRYGGRESDEEDAGIEASELIKHELAEEGTSVKSIAERKKPEVHHE